MIGVIRHQQIDKLLLGAVPCEPHSPVLATSGMDQVPGKLNWRLKTQKAWCVAQQSVTLRAVQRRRPGDPPRADSLSSITLTREGSTEK